MLNVILSVEILFKTLHKSLRILPNFRFLGQTFESLKNNHKIIKNTFRGSLLLLILRLPVKRLEKSLQRLFGTFVFTASEH